MLRKIKNEKEKNEENDAKMNYKMEIPFSVKY